MYGTAILGELIVDLGLWPRTELQASNQKSLLEAYLAGEELPPIVVDKRTKIITDGINRFKMYRRVLKDGDKIKVDWKEYKTRAEMFEDAIRLNARHGQPLTMHDRAHSILIAKELGLSLSRIANAMGMERKRLESFFEARIRPVEPDTPPEKPRRRVLVSNEDGTMEYVATKPAARHMESLNPEQVKVNKDLPGNCQGKMVHDIVALIRANMIDWSDDDVVSGLKELRKVLTIALRERGL